MIVAFYSEDNHNTPLWEWENVERDCFPRIGEHISVRNLEGYCYAEVIDVFWWGPQMRVNITVRKGPI